MRACAVEMHMDMMSQEVFCGATYRENAEPVFPDTRFVRACADTWTCHKRHFARQFTGKMPNPYPPTPVLYAPAQTHGHVTKGILRGNLQGKCRTLPIQPRLNTGP